MTVRWRTRLDTPLARCLGVVAHTVVFRHRADRGGSRFTVGIQVPEATEQQIREGLELARATKARICVVSDTAHQAETMATRIAITCAQHQRVPTSAPRRVRADVMKEES